MKRLVLLGLLGAALVGCDDTLPASQDAAVDRGLDPDQAVPDSAADQSLPDQSSAPDQAEPDGTPPAKDHGLTPDGSQPQPCDPQDAVGEGACEMMLGWVWNGKLCDPLGGCSCVGNDCNKLFDTEAACAAAYYSSCLCPAQDIAGEGQCKMLIGVQWDGERCLSLGGCSCKGADCGDIYSTIADCEKANYTCICAPMDIEAVGNCKMILGVTWDGAQCVSLGGCSCQGSDCSQIYPAVTGMADCEADHQVCLSP